MRVGSCTFYNYLTFVWVWDPAAGSKGSALPSVLDDFGIYHQNNLFLSLNSV